MIPRGFISPRSSIMVPPQTSRMVNSSNWKDSPQYFNTMAFGTPICLTQIGVSVTHFLHPVISNFIQERLEELNSKGQAPSRMEQLAKRLEETWGRTYSNIQMTNVVSPKTTPQGKATWEPDPKPLMVNHPPRVTDSNTRITLIEDSLNGPCPRDDSGLGWVQIQRKSLLWRRRSRDFQSSLTRDSRQ
jgi:hypothetical protein